MFIVVDFDGTCVSHEFPNVGNDIGAVPILKKLVNAGHKLILFTMRSDRLTGGDTQTEGIDDVIGEFLTDAVKWFAKNDIPLYGIQTNPTQKSWTTSPKAYGELIIDDAALGCPLMFDSKISKRPFCDWEAIENELEILNVLPTM